MPQNQDTKTTWFGVLLIALLGASERSGEAPKRESRSSLSFADNASLSSQNWFSFSRIFFLISNGFKVFNRFSILLLLVSSKLLLCNNLCAGLKLTFSCVRFCWFHSLTLLFCFIVTQKRFFHRLHCSPRHLSASR